MKKGLGIVRAVSCAAVLLFGSACFAATSTPFVAAGSTGAYNATALGGSVSSYTVGISSITGDGSTATVTCATTCGFTAGEANVSVVGTGTAFDATNVTVITDSGTTFTYASANTTPASGGIAGITPTCGNLANNANVALSTTTYIWTDSGKSGDQDLQGVDGRSGSFVAQNAAAWVTWQTTNPDDSTSTPTAVCEYLSVDSIVGLRLFFATNSGGTAAGVVSFPGNCTSALAGDVSSQIPLMPADTTMPTGVCSVLNGLPFNAAPTDVRAEDGAYQVSRICGTYSAAGTGYGLTCGRGGSTPTIINSGIGSSTKNVQVVDFSIAGLDPVTSVQIAHSAAGSDTHPWVSLNGGGQTELILVNTSDTATNGFGSAALTNIDRPDLGRVFVGAATRTRDIIPGTGLASKPLTALVREPLSGTYTTFENQVTRTVEFNHSLDQVTNNGGGQVLFGVGMTPCPSTGWTFFACPTAAADTLDAKRTATGGLKVRVIGTGEMVACIALTSGCASTKDDAGNSITNQIGYAFFSFANVKPAIGLAKYLTVDGVDPLFASYSGGALPSCSAPCSGAVSLQNIANGSYPIWNILRIVTTGPLGASDTHGNCLSGATVCQLVKEMQASYSQIPDLVPISSMQAFRSHITLTANTEDGSTAFPAHNGYKHFGAVSGTPCGQAPVVGAAVVYECGKDANGARFLIQQELDTNSDFASELTAITQ